MPLPQNEFEKQVIQIAGLGVWQIVTGKPMTKKLDPVADARWQEKTGLFVTLRIQGQIRGSMGIFESSTSLPETLFDVGQAAATHDTRFPPIEEREIHQLDIEVSLLSEIKKLKDPSDLILGETGLIVSRGESRGVLLPQVALDNKWSAEQFLEACCEKAKLSHKAWKDPNTLVEYFGSRTIHGGNLIGAVAGYV